MSDGGYPQCSSDALDRGIRQLTALISATQAQLLGMIAAFTAAGGPAHDGCRDTAAWLRMIGYSAATAAELARIAEALADLPVLAKRFAAGELTWDQLRPATRIATADTDADVAADAVGMTVAALERWARAMHPPTEADGAGDYEQRKLRIQWLFDGRVGKVFGQLPADSAAVLFGVIDKRARQMIDEADAAHTPLSYEQACHDALIELAAQKLDADFGAAANLIVYNVRDGAAEIQGGPVVDPATKDQAECGARSQTIVWNQAGEPVKVSALQPSLTAMMRRAVLDAFAGTCAFPGCGRRRWIHIHHIAGEKAGHHWANLIPLCFQHHTLIHKGGWTVIRGPDNTFTWRDPTGRHLITTLDPLDPDIRKRLLD